MPLCHKTNIMHMKHDASLFVSGLGEKPMSKMIQQGIARISQRQNVIPLSNEILYLKRGHKKGRRINLR